MNSYALGISVAFALGILIGAVMGFMLKTPSEVPVGNMRVVLEFGEDGPHQLPAFTISAGLFHGRRIEMALLELRDH